ncbi:hypothetical protein TW81_13950 [Vibrio galatheae]|uniref:Uncharacterized protein n=1 Tax=Vibrio galatheae TaxID=579748 RepID=A0A0F4NH65_9VIBR|nr:hypothetical protein TW81_13950 [Vibrio galatheae]
MQLHELVNTIGQDLQRRYGEKVHKLTLHGGFSCPNRDGTQGSLVDQPFVYIKPTIKADY